MVLGFTLPSKLTGYQLDKNCVRPTATTSWRMVGPKEVGTGEGSIGGITVDTQKFAGH